ncbi:MAG: substrate-binding domain-containing protein [Thainema sp.]
MVLRSIPRYILKRYLLRYPVPVRMVKYQRLLNRQWFKSVLQEIRPEVIPADADEEIQVQPLGQPTIIATHGIQPPPSYYHQYRCDQRDPLNCARPLYGTTLSDQQWDRPESTTNILNIPACSLCGFPGTLLPERKIVGRRGVYRVGACLGRRGWGRLYAAMQEGAEVPVTIKEYLLPTKYFNSQHQHQRQQLFISLAGLTLADGRFQDSRVIAPIEAIADPEQERCYLITSATDQHPTLNQQLLQGAFSPVSVYQLLNQTLQSLAFLHQQKFALPLGQVQTGMVHGNIRLDSLLWVEQGEHPFVYLTDVALWEFLFNPTHTTHTQTTVQDDLIHLGQVAFYTLTGTTVNEQYQPLSPRLDVHWPELTPPALKQFILRLLGIEVPFENAEVARAALLRIPPAMMENEFAAPAERLVPKSRTWLRRGVIAGISLLVLALLAGLIWLLIRPRAVTIADEAPPICCFEEVGAVPKGEFRYTSVDDDPWNQLVRLNLEKAAADAAALTGSGSDSTGLAPLGESSFIASADAPNAESADEAAEPTLPENPTLMQQLQFDQPDFQLTYRSSASVTAAVDQVISGAVDFAILPRLADLPPDTAAEVFAHDGLAMLVAFNYPKRSQSLPKALNGEITLQQLQQLYTDQVRNWDEFSRADLPVSLYRPFDSASAAMFEQLVLRSDRNIDTFRNLGDGEIQSLKTIPMLRSILRDFEIRQTGAVGFAPLSLVFGQCSVYPLALDWPRRAEAQLLEFAGEPITPNLDLCDRKGSYQPNAELIRQGTYPLAYPVTVIYQRDNSRPEAGAKFAELLKTTEGQEFLAKFGFTTLRQLEDE